jgi:TIR domain
MACDIFISFKNLDESGVPTRDAELAKEVYDFLTSKDLSVFISTVTLEELGVSDYKKAIDDALDTAAIVVAVGTSIENLNSKWVRYEWDSFYVDMLSGVKPRGRVFTYVEGMLPAQLPRTLRQTQTFIHSPEELEQLYTFVVQSLRQEQPATTRIPLPLEAVPHPQPSATTAPIPRPRVFVSFTIGDEPYATALSEAIAQAGFDVFSRKKQLDAGEDWRASIEREIQDCTFFVPIISENTERRTEGLFRKEWALASERSHRMARDRPFIIPIVAGKLDAPTLIPETFRRVNWTLMEGPTVPPFLVEFFRQHA